MFSLHFRMLLMLSLMFGIIYAVIVMIGTSMGYASFNFYLIIALGMMFFQYLIGPKIIEWSMRIKYIKRDDSPKLFAIVEDQARRAKIPMPKVCISDTAVPNAFAFGRGVRDGRVCVTRGIMNLLSEDELRAVIGHEIAHIRNRDVLTITLLSVIPMILYRVAWHFLFYGGHRRDGRDNTALIGLVALVFYFITNLLVLYASRIREYFADQGAVEFGNRPSSLASALYKLVYGAARTDKETLHEVEGARAFFINDPSQAMREIRELRQLDVDQSGTIDSSELARLRNMKIKLGFADYLMEGLSTHPNMLKRIDHLSQLNLNRPYSPNSL